ncbi:MAG: hypothetical protein ACKVIO_02905 [Phycisphaerales bacterium]
MSPALRWVYGRQGVCGSFSFKKTKSKKAARERKDGGSAELSCWWQGCRPY